METKIAIVDTKLNSLNSSFERHIADYRTLRATFTNVTMAIVGVMFGVSAAFVGGVYSLSHDQGSLAEQQKQFADKQVQFSDQQDKLSRQQEDIHQEISEIKTQLVKINKAMDIILKEHESFHK